MKPVTRFLRNNLVGTKEICIILCALLLAVTVYIFTRNVDQDKYSVELSYKEELQQVVVSAVRKSPEYEPMNYEFRGPELLRLIGVAYSDGVDVMTFEIAADGITEMVFYSVDSNDADNIYGHAYKCEISITGDYVDVGGRLWHR